MKKRKNNNQSMMNNELVMPKRDISSGTPKFSTANNKIG